MAIVPLALFALISLSSSSSAEDALSYLLLSFEAVHPFVALYWLVLGAVAFTGALALTDWALDSARVLLPDRALLALSVAAWVLELIASPQLGLGHFALQSLGRDVPISPGWP